MLETLFGRNKKELIPDPEEPVIPPDPEPEPTPEPEPEPIPDPTPVIDPGTGQLDWTGVPMKATPLYTVAASVEARFDLVSDGKTIGYKVGNNATMLTANASNVWTAGTAMTFRGTGITVSDNGNILQAYGTSEGSTYNTVGIRENGSTYQMYREREFDGLHGTNLENSWQKPVSPNGLYCVGIMNRGSGFSGLHYFNTGTKKFSHIYDTGDHITQAFSEDSSLLITYGKNVADYNFNVYKLNNGVATLIKTNEIAGNYGININMYMDLCANGTLMAMTSDNNKIRIFNVNPTTGVVSLRQELDLGADDTSVTHYGDHQSLSMSSTGELIYVTLPRSRNIHIIKRDSSGIYSVVKRIDTVTEFGGKAIRVMIAKKGIHGAVVTGPTNTNPKNGKLTVFKMY